MTSEVARQLVEDLRGMRTRVRIKERASSPYEWDWPLFSPAISYLETAASGPIALADIEQIHVEKEEKRQRGSLVPPLSIDHTTELEALFRSHGLIFESNDCYISIYT